VAEVQIGLGAVFGDVDLAVSPCWKGFIVPGSTFR